MGTGVLVDFPGEHRQLVRARDALLEAGKIAAVAAGQPPPALVAVVADPDAHIDAVEQQPQSGAAALDGDAGGLDGRLDDVKQPQAHALQFGVVEAFDHGAFCDGTVCR